MGRFTLLLGLACWFAAPPTAGAFNIGDIGRRLPNAAASIVRFPIPTETTGASPIATPPPSAPTSAVRDAFQQWATASEQKAAVYESHGARYNALYWAALLAIVGASGTAAFLLSLLEGKPRWLIALSAVPAIIQGCQHNIDIAGLRETYSIAGVALARVVEDCRLDFNSASDEGLRQLLDRCKTQSRAIEDSVVNRTRAANGPAPAPKDGG